MAEQSLDEPDIGPALQHQRRGRMAQQMAGTGLGDAGVGDVAAHPARWGGDQAGAFDEVAIELRTGDRVQFTSNNRRAQRNNGDIANVRAINPQGTSVLVEKDDGSQQMLDLNRLADRHLRHG